MSRIRSFVRNLVKRERVERELDEELQATLDALIDEHVRRGMPAAGARRAAMMTLGRIDSVKEQVRDVRSGAFIELLVQDARFAARALARSPLLTITAVLFLGAGIAGNAIVSSLADAYLFRDRPGIADLGRLAEVGRVDSGEGGHYTGDGFDTFSYPNYVDYCERQTVFEGLAAYHVGGIATFGLGTPETAARVPGAYVSANYVDVQ